jgi:cell division protein FtsN
LKQARQPQRGGTLLGVIIGLVLGLAIAAGVTLYITQAPVPFVQKVKRPTENVNPGADGRLPDPNRPLTAQPPSPPPATPAEAAQANVEPAPATPAEAAKTASAKAADAAESGTRYMLQAGAFRQPEDADSMRARLALLGLDAKIFPVETAGNTYYRVRLGPYGQRTELERVQKQVNDDGVPTQVIPIK